MGFYGVVTEAIFAYTGLSVMEFLSIGTLMVVVYKIVCGMFVSEDDFKPKSTKKIEPIELGDNVTKEELIKYNGSDPKKPLLMAIRGQIYDVSSSRMFYGPGSPYHMFVGKDASRALALLSFKPDDITGNIEGLGEDELAVLLDWEMRFIEKYPRVGQLVGAGRRIDLELTGSATSSEEPWRLAEESKKVM